MRDRLREWLQEILDRLYSLRNSDEDDLDDEEPIARWRPQPSRKLTENQIKERNRRRRWMLAGAAVLIVLCVVFGLYRYSRRHTYTDYIISRSIENTMTPGTKYESVGRYLYRYNTDGVSCVTRKNEVKWSITYSMQAPIVDVCGSTMVIAEQQGTQIYVVNENGLLGNFSSLLPILKVRVSNQGLVAAVLQDEDVTWVNLYDSSGESIVSDKTTISDSGYPLDVDVAPNGMKMAVSYFGVKEGVMTSEIVFYDFSSGGGAGEEYVINRESISGSAAPRVYFIDNSTAAVVLDDGFLVYRGSAMARSEECWFDEEIVSCFYSEDIIGFLFSDLTGEHIYRMELYNYHAKRKVSTGIDTDFDTIKIENGRILMYTSSYCNVYTMQGRLKYSSAYEKEIVEAFYFDEYRRYLIITQDSFDRIRIC